jgi:3-oxoacyl-[acyl-carrier protein] reductase
MADADQSKKVVVVTGASRGLGRALAEHYLAQGYAVAGCSRGEATISDSGYHHTTVDIRKETEVQAWARALRREFGGVDVLIANAGLARSALYLSLTPGEVFDDFMRVNFAGVFYRMHGY